MAKCWLCNKTITKNFICFRCGQAMCGDCRVLKSGLNYCKNCDQGNVFSSPPAKLDIPSIPHIKPGQLIKKYSSDFGIKDI